MKVVLLHDDVREDARPDELDVFAQVEVVSAALHRLGHHTSTMPFAFNLDRTRDELRRAAPDVVFNLVEAVQGQGRLIHLAPALLDSMGLTYVGSGTVPMFVTSNKTLAKQVLGGHRIDTPPWFSRDDLSRSLSIPRRRYLVKSTWEEASVGLDDDSLVATDNPADLLAALDARIDRLGGEGFVEAFIDGREFNLSVLAGRDGVPAVLPPAEIDFVGYAPDKPRFVNYKAKWDEASYEYHHTPRRFDFPDRDAPLLETLAGIARDCWTRLDLHGWARIDFRVDETGRPWVLEVNANPCLSPDAGFSSAVHRAGLTLDQAVERILTDAVTPVRRV